MRALKIAGAAIGAVIVVLALLLVIGIPSGFLTSQIQERVERETGYKLAINGGDQDRALAVAQHHLKRHRAAGSERPRHQQPLTASSIQADVTLASVWSGRPRSPNS